MKDGGDKEEEGEGKAEDPFGIDVPVGARRLFLGYHKINLP